LILNDLLMHDAVYLNLNFSLTSPHPHDPPDQELGVAQATREQTRDACLLAAFALLFRSASLVISG
jgi:hypothetical protein